ncbi:spore coat-associated protein [Fictibacillus macauensis ZFHKF-1]|uniref:Spore coat-associated protein n=1 Tax=Fictibacillus macauensis ZFHKF-1 TaxID=1196324 RepID=I8ALB6_9BACL|nr:TasA family protein [Fictibacillus macauensis]EIT86682.1 spore coat-associated protein [Fictibacillus macauensis ZFHKF-1]
MSLKKKIGLGVASAALGLSLIGTGTYAYFSDTETSQNTFASGTLDLAMNPSVLVDLKDLKPGDVIRRDFTLANNGTLAIKSVSIKTSYDVKDVKNDNNGSDLGGDIRVNFLFNTDKMEKPVWTTTLKDLKAMSPDAVKDKFESIYGDAWGTKGLAPNSKDKLTVEFEFVDSGKDQNVFQGDSLNLKWDFTATQTAGEKK